MKAWVWKRCRFDAAHSLPLHKGACKNLHGHTYTVELGVLCDVDAETGMGIDLMDLKKFLYDNVVARFDHGDLNVQMPRGCTSTAENIANLVADHALRVWDCPVRVRVFETPDSWVEVER